MTLSVCHPAGLCSRTPSCLRVQLACWIPSTYDDHIDRQPIRLVNQTPRPVHGRRPNMAGPRELMTGINQSGVRPTHGPFRQASGRHYTAGLHTNSRPDGLRKSHRPDAPYGPLRERHCLQREMPDESTHDSPQPIRTYVPKGRRRPVLDVVGHLFMHGEIAVDGVTRVSRTERPRWL